jgi:hypothetical protein
MGIPMLLQRSEYCEHFECLNCNSHFHDEHGNPCHGWSWCPICGIKFEGAMLYRAPKWRREYPGVAERMDKCTLMGWVVEKRWHGFDNEIEEWEEVVGSWTPNDRKRLLLQIRCEREDERFGKEDGRMYWEYRIVRKEASPHWSRYWMNQVLGEHT